MGERTARVLTARLSELATAAERSGAPAPAIARLLEAASIATMNAVALELLTAGAAREIWQRVEEEHPVLAELRDAA